MKRFFRLGWLFLILVSSCQSSPPVGESRPAVSLIFRSPQGERILQTSALTVGEALAEAGIPLAAEDLLIPPAETSIDGTLTVTLIPARELTVIVGGQALKVRSAVDTVGGVLAGAGIPLVGLDFSVPPEGEGPPADGQIRVVRVREAFDVSLESIPFEEKVSYTSDLPLGQSEVIQPGVEGVAMLRERVRYEDGAEVSRVREERVVLREPQPRIVQSGEKIAFAPAGGEIPYEYWYSTEMYATVYSPCQSGTGGCSYGTASGARAGYGIVAVDYSIYPYLAGMRIYIPGYGLATIGDTGGGPVIESALGVSRAKWIDLGFDDGQITDMTGWIKVYFLTPAPAEIPYFFK